MLLIADVDGTRDVVVAGWNTRYAVVRRVAGFRSVAPEVIVAQAVVGRVDAYIVALIAEVIGTGYAVVTGSRRSRGAEVLCVTDFVTIAPGIVLATAVVNAIDTIVVAGGVWIGVPEDRTRCGIALRLRDVLPTAARPIKIKTASADFDGDLCRCKSYKSNEVMVLVEERSVRSRSNSN